MKYAGLVGAGFGVLRDQLCSPYGPKVNCVRPLPAERDHYETVLFYHQRHLLRAVSKTRWPARGQEVLHAEKGVCILVDLRRCLLRETIIHQVVIVAKLSREAVVTINVACRELLLGYLAQKKAPTPQGPP